MAFKKGDVRPANSGRQKGTPNKSTASYRETLTRLKFDCAEEAVALYRSGELEANQKLGLLELITSYSHFKPKPIDESEDFYLSVPLLSDEDAIKALEGR